MNYEEINEQPQQGMGNCITSAELSSSETFFTTFSLSKKLDNIENSISICVLSKITKYTRHRKNCTYTFKDFSNDLSITTTSVLLVESSENVKS